MIDENLEHNKAFEFIRTLIDACKFKDETQSSWGGTDIIFVTSGEYESKKDSLDNWKKESECHKLVITNNTPIIIWLINQLKPLIRVDYLKKYKYYSDLANFVTDYEKKYKKREGEDIDLDGQKAYLNFLLDKLENYEQTPPCKTGKRKLKDWYDFGKSNNDPFFVKFVALWICFNQEYRCCAESKCKNGEKLGDDRKQIKTYCNTYMPKLLNKYDRIFKSSLTPIIHKTFLKQAIKTHIQNSANPDLWELTDGNTKDFENLKQTNNKDDRIHGLFQTLYTIRCNLFHGHKKTDSPRDVDLVRYAGEILEIFLEKDD